MDADKKVHDSVWKPVKRKTSRSESEDLYKMKLPSMNELKDCFFHKKQKRRRLSDSIPSTIDNDNVYLYDFELKSSTNISIHGHDYTTSSSLENTPTSTPKYGFSFPPIKQKEEEKYEFFCKNMTKDLKQIAKIPITPCLRSSDGETDRSSISDIDIIPPPIDEKIPFPGFYLSGKSNDGDDCENITKCFYKNTIIDTIRNYRKLNTFQIKYMENFSVHELINIILEYNEMYDALIQSMASDPPTLNNTPYENEQQSYVA